MKVFDLDKPVPNYLIKHEKTHTALALALSLIAAPILSALMIATKGVNLVTTSISKLGWQNDMLPVVYLWGLYNLALFAYLLKITLDKGQYSKRSKILFYSLTAAGCVILLVGISIPFISDEIYQHYVMRKVHNAFATVGFVLFVVILIALTVTTFFRNRLQAYISAGLMCFLIITGIFSVLCVNSPEKATFITAASQMYIFSMLHVILACQYIMNGLLPNEHAIKQNDTEIAKSAL